MNVEALCIDRNELVTIGVYQWYGKIEKGYVADIIAVKENPLENIHTLKCFA